MADYENDVRLLTARILDLVREGADEPDPVIVMGAITSAMGMVVRGCWAPSNRAEVIYHYAHEIHEHCVAQTSRVN